MSLFQVPLTNVPQTFQIPIGDTTYQVTSKWNNSEEAGWVLDIADQDGNPLAFDIPMITGANLLAGLEYLGISGKLFIFTDGDDNAVPTFDNLGVESNLYLFQED